MSQIVPLPTARAAKPAQEASAPAQRAAPIEPPPAPAHNQRLLIQETGEAGVFVYTLMDCASGDVLAQIPLLGSPAPDEDADHAAGKVIDTSA